jgi:hypothetical protein
MIIDFLNEKIIKACYLKNQAETIFKRKKMIRREKVTGEF